jgi:hypothetical protein
MTDPTVLKIALAGLLHDVGKNLPQLGTESRRMICR